MNEQVINEQSLSKTGRIFTTLSNPIRLKILTLLEQHKVMNVTSLVAILEMEQASVSHNLILMKNFGILQSKRRGKNTDYYITKGVLEKIEKTIGLWS